ncbi:MAG: hypothetical protein QOJ99_4035 [Bryobacterales bacterium]|jgi:hypothetical protein|nr:hypothetical protein [Bryobacterales bacterium]
MTMIELPDEQAAALNARAASMGLSLKGWLETLAKEAPAAGGAKPFKTGRGSLARYGPAPSLEDIAENRRDMFSGFAKDF